MAVMIIAIPCAAGLYLVAVGPWLVFLCRRSAEIRRLLPYLITSIVFPPILWFKATYAIIAVRLRWPGPVAAGIACLVAFGLLVSVVGVCDILFAFARSAPSVQMIWLIYWWLLPLFHVVIALRTRAWANTEGGQPQIP